jgi:hypothetical protein
MKVYAIHVEIMVRALDAQTAKDHVRSMLHQYPYDSYKHEGYEITAVERVADV